MKVTELMIGDWVMKDETPTQVTSISSHYGIIEGVIGDESVGISVNDTKPIFITTEILEKNKFSSAEVAQIIFLSLKGIKLTYVHELQHALRLVGLNDLADNFKI